MKPFKLIALSVLVVFVFSGFNDKQKTYLPVTIKLNDSTSDKSDLMINVKAAFGAKKIKVISREDADAYSRAETNRVRDEFRSRGGKLTDFEAFKNFASSNSRYVVTILFLNITTDSSGIISDTIGWDKMAMPINLGNFPKKNPKYMVLDSLNSTSLLKFSQSLVDSIIASNILEKE